MVLHMKKIQPLICWKMERLTDKFITACPEKGVYPKASISQYKLNIYTLCNSLLKNHYQTADMFTKLAGRVNTEKQ